MTGIVTECVWLFLEQVKSPYRTLVVQWKSNLTYPLSICPQTQDQELRNMLRFYLIEQKTVCLCDTQKTVKT